MSVKWSSVSFTRHSLSLKRERLLFLISEQKNHDDDEEILTSLEKLRERKWKEGLSIFSKVYSFGSLASILVYNLHFDCFTSSSYIFRYLIPFIFPLLLLPVRLVCTSFSKYFPIFPSSHPTLELQVHPHSCVFISLSLSFILLSSFISFIRSFIHPLTPFYSLLFLLITARMHLSRFGSHSQLLRDRQSVSVSLSSHLHWWCKNKYHLLVSFSLVLSFDTDTWCNTLFISAYQFLLLFHMHQKQQQLLRKDIVTQLYFVFDIFIIFCKHVLCLTVEVQFVLPLTKDRIARIFALRQSNLSK